MTLFASKKATTAASTGLAGIESPAQPGSLLISRESRDFLTSLTQATVAACRVAPGASTGNTLPFAAICPGGRGCYPAIWIQDFTMIYSSGLVPREEGLKHLRLLIFREEMPHP